MSKLDPLTVTLELPASELIEHEGAILVRCQKHRGWIPLADYYSEEYSLLPIVGNAVCNHPGCDWKETVRILKSVEVVPAEGGTLAFNVEDGVGTKEKF